MNQYILMLHHDPKTFRAEEIEPQQLQEIFNRYRAWRDRMTAEGRIAGGNKLDDATGRVMRRNGDSDVHVTDGPFAEAKEIIGGFFVIKAEDYDDAVRIAEGCPHLQYGTIEIRLIEV